MTLAAILQATLDAAAREAWVASRGWVVHRAWVTEYGGRPGSATHSF